jgi:WD40 repeat protein
MTPSRDAKGSDRSPGRVSVRVLGTPTIAVDDREVATPELRARQARILLTLLALAGADGVHRDVLGRAIWATKRPRTWETTLSALVSRLRSAFARVGVAGDAFAFDSGVYRFSAPSHVHVDVRDAIDAMKRAREAVVHGDTAEARALAQAVAAHFRGPVLPGEDSEPVRDARRQITEVQQEALALLNDSSTEDEPRADEDEPLADEDATQHAETTQVTRPASALASILSILLALAVGFAIFAVRERNGARASARDALIQSLVAASDARRASSAELALLLARQASEIQDSPDTRAALFAALAEPAGLSGFLRRDAPVTAMAAGPTANVVVTGHADGNIVIWDAQRHLAQVGTASARGASVRAIAVDPDRMRVASGCDDGSIREWDVRNGSPLGDQITYKSPLDGTTTGITSLAYRDGLLVAVGRDSTFRRYTDTGNAFGSEVLQELPDANVDYGVVQSIDRGATVYARPGLGGIVVWDLNQPASSGKRGFFALEQGSAVRAVAIAPSGAFAVSSIDNLLDTWDTSTFQRMGASIEMGGTVSNLAVSPDGGTIAVGLVGGDVRLVDVLNQKVLPTALGGASEPVSALAFDVTGDMLYVGRAGGTTAAYSLRELAMMRRLPPHKGEGRSIAFGTRGLVAAAGSGPATLWSTKEPGRTPAVMAQHADIVAARPGTDEIAVATQNRVVLADGISPSERELLRLDQAAGSVTALTFDEGGRMLAVATSRGGVSLVDLDRGVIALPSLSGIDVSAFAFTDADELWVAGPDRVRSYNVTDGHARRTLTDPRLRNALALASDPSRHRIAVGTATGVVFVDLDDLLVSGPFLGELGPVRGVAYSAGGALFAAAVDGGGISVWEGHSLLPLGAPLPLPRASAVAFSPDGASLGAVGLGGDAVLISTDLAAWRRAACAIAGRQLTKAEWDEFLPGMRFAPAC